MRAYSDDMRRAAMGAYEQCDYSQPRIARLFGISPATVRNWVRRKREMGAPDAFAHAGGARAKLGPRARERVRQLVRGRNEILLSELCEQIGRELRTRVSESTMCRVGRALGLPRKKGRSTPVSETRRGSGGLGRSTER